MTALHVLTAFVLRCLTTMFIAKRVILYAINRADICEDDKRFIRSVLGIPQNGER